MIFKHLISQFDNELYDMVSTSVTGYEDSIDIIDVLDDEPCEIYNTWSSTSSNKYTKYSTYRAGDQFLYKTNYTPYDNVVHSSIKGDRIC